MSRLPVPLDASERAALRALAAGMESSLGVRPPEGRVARLLILEALQRRGVSLPATQAGGEE